MDAEDKRTTALALIAEYQAFRLVALWFDICTTLCCIGCVAAFYIAMTGRPWPGLLLAITSIVLGVRCLMGMSEKFQILRAIAADIAALCAHDTMFRHDARRINSRVRLLFDLLFFCLCGIAGILAILVAISHLTTPAF